jgi:hypothetical protein
MAITAQSIIERATDLLQDKTLVRWGVAELVRWFNDAQRAVIKVRPDAMNITTVMTLAAGPRQDLDNAALALLPVKLIEITRNMAVTSKKSAVMSVGRRLLDLHSPAWYAMKPSVDVVHFMFDPRDPKTFYVYPPATELAQLEIMYSAYPADIEEPAEGSLFTAVTGNLSLPDIYADDVLNLIMFRAHSKDAEFGGNTALAAGYMAMATASLGAEIAATVAVGPKG